MARPGDRVKENAYVEKRAGVRGGAAVITGTGIRVLDVAIRYEVIGMTPEEIMIALPHIDLAQIHGALSYYHAHKAELDKEWNASLKKIARLRAKTPSILEEKLDPIKNLH